MEIASGIPSRRDAMANSKADGKTSHSGLRVRKTSDADCCSGDAKRFAYRARCRVSCTREVAGLPRDLRARKGGCRAYAAGSFCTGEEVGRMGAAIRGSQQGVAQTVAVGLEGRGGCREGSFRFDLADGQENFRSSFLSARGKPGRKFLTPESRAREYRSTIDADKVGATFDTGGES